LAEESKTGSVQNETSAIPKTSLEQRSYGSLDSLPSDDLLVFQTKLWALLDRRVTLFTSGESSSLPLLTAKELLTSMLYVLELDLDELCESELRRLALCDLEAAFEQGLVRVKEKAKQAKQLWEEVCLSTPLLKSVALKDTLNALEAFISGYDYRFFAARLECMIDYPLSKPVSESIQGIDYINEYLSRLVLENSFMGRFELEQVKSLMKAVSPDYRILVINLFEQVATNAIGLALVEGNVFGLSVSEEQRIQIAEEFKGLSARKAKQRLSDANKELCRVLKIQDKALQDYLEELAIGLYPRIKAVSAFGGLAGIFLTF